MLRKALHRKKTIYNILLFFYLYPHRSIVLLSVPPLFLLRPFLSKLRLKAIIGEEKERGLQTLPTATTRKEEGKKTQKGISKLNKRWGKKSTGRTFLFWRGWGKKGH